MSEIEAINEFKIDVPKFLERNKDTIIKNLNKDFQKYVQDSVRWKSGDELEKLVGNFMKDEIMPEVAKYLDANKEKIVQGVLETTAQIGEALAAKMAEKALENIRKDSWNMRDVYKKIFE